MAGVRLVPKRTVDAHEALLRNAVQAAWAEQLVKLTVTLRSHGISLPALTAAGPAVAAARGHISVPHLWSQQSWQRSLATHLAPVASSVTKASLDAATATLRLPSLWGQADSTDATAEAIVARATSVGQWIGDRLDAAAVRGPAPPALIAAARRPNPAAPPPGSSSGGGTAAAEDVVEVDLAAVLGTAPDILGDIISAMANASATMASEDVTSYLASYVVSAEAEPYLSATKTWNNVGDEKVRDSHQGVDDVSINELFDVGGGMAGPGDPAGDDSETINCRCWVTYDGVVPEGSGYEDGGAPDYQGENA